MRDSFIAIPNWFSSENQGVGIAVASLEPGREDLIVFMVDAPLGRNRGLYRIGKDLDPDGKVTGDWTDWRDVPEWFSSTNEGAGIAVADLDGTGKVDLVVFMVDAPAGPNRGLYRVGKDLDRTGDVKEWTTWTDVPNWGSWSNQGAGIALADLDGSGQLDLVVFKIDNPVGENNAKYRVGRNLDGDGNVTGGWGPWIPVDKFFSWENQGAGVAVIDQPAGKKDLVLFHVDNPIEQNQAFYRIGSDLQPDGTVSGTWSPWYGVPDWFSWNNQGASIAVRQRNGPTPLQLLVVMADSPARQNTGYYQSHVLDEKPAIHGSWELLKYDSQVLAVHAAVLPRGKVLFFAGSGNNGVRFADPDFGDTSKNLWCSVVWDPSAGNNFNHPDTLKGVDGRPIDFFCGGDTLLADGRIISAGGTLEYDVDGNNKPADHGFYGRQDAVVFDPVAGQWSPIASMAHGRWYPSLITLGDGRVLATSGLDEDGHANKTLEIYSPDRDSWTSLDYPLLMSLLGLPLYAHLFLLADGEVLYTGGRMDDANPNLPCLIDLTRNPVGIRLVHGLQAPLSRNQSASVILPPAQEQKILVMGGALPIGEGNATDSVDVIDLRSLAGGVPNYQPAARLKLPRVHLNAVILPDRTIFVSGGALQREGGPQGERKTFARLQSEIYNPETGRWSMAATAKVERMYHSIALLLPDGRVVAAGGNPDKGDKVPWGVDDNEELQLEIYSPPYLSGQPRPEMRDVPEDWTYGQTVTIKTPRAGSILWANLIRPGVTTHSFDTSQRLVDLPILSRGTDQIQVSVTTEHNVAPPGWYMLFITNNDRIPSVASWVRLSA